MSNDVILLFLIIVCLPIAIIIFVDRMQDNIDFEKLSEAIIYYLKDSGFYKAGIPAQDYSLNHFTNNEQEKLMKFYFEPMSGIININKYIYIIIKDNRFYGIEYLPKTRFQISIFVDNVEVYDFVPYYSSFYNEPWYTKIHSINNYNIPKSVIKAINDWANNTIANSPTAIKEHSERILNYSEQSTSNKRESYKADEKNEEEIRIKENQKKINKAAKEMKEV